MTPEMRLAQALGTLPTSSLQKLAHSMDELSVDQLESILRSEGMGRGPSFQEKVAMADAWGRELAHAAFEKTAAPGAVGMAVGKGLNAVMGTGIGARTAIGAGGGAALGAAKNVIAPQKDANGQPVKNGVMRGALMGAAGGAVLGAGSRKAAIAVGSGTGRVGQGVRRVSAHAMGPAGQGPIQAGSARAGLTEMRQGAAATRAKAIKPAAPAAAPAPAPRALGPGTPSIPVQNAGPTTF